MSIKHIIRFGLIIICLQMVTVAFSQNRVSGNIKDGESGETLIGVNIIIKNTIKGTISDLDGNYEMNVGEALPYTLIFSMVGFETKEVEVNEANAVIDLALETKSILANEVVISASRVEERIMQSPVSIEKLDLVSIKNSTSADFYDEVLKLKGVTNNMASLTFNTINTRGFGGGGNTRFVQLQDGMDNAAPLLNFPTGNVVGISELDIRSVELVPGAASALYGPNAFNGILIMQSKDPFQYQGLSATFKTGLIEGTNYTNPLNSGAIRYAKAFNDKIAFKINFSGLWASDWRAQNYTDDRNLVALAAFDPTIDTKSLVGKALFDGLNTYGDESFIPVAGGLRRTGWKEQDLLESNDAKSFKYDGAIHYRITDKVEANVSYKYGAGSTVYQGSERYALRNFSQQFAKFEINGANWNFKTYGSFTDAGDSYNLTALGAFTNENVWQSIYNQTVNITPEGGGPAFPVPLRGGWAVAANIAAGLPGFNPDAAKAFADAGGFSTLPAAQREGVAQQIAAGSTFAALPASYRLPAARELIKLATGPARPAVGSAEFNRIVSLVRDDLLFQKGGAGFIDNSAMYHTEGSYNLSSLVNDAVSWQIGGNFRRYDLFSDGTVFNEDPDGDGVNERIKINEFGIYTQLSKTILDDKLKLTGSLRYDKNQNFKGQVSPRVSFVYSAGDNKEHNFRGSFQTGFRNPTTQGQFIYFPTTSILLGSTKANAEPFGIHNGGSYTLDSYNRYLAALQSGVEPGVATQRLETISFDYIQPEQLQSFELGYRGTMNKKVNIDISGFYNIYNNFIDQIFVVNKNATTPKAAALGNPDPVTGTVRSTFYPYINVPAKITSYGLNVGLDVAIAKNWKLSPNYSYNKANKAAATDLPGFENYDPGFNMPLHMTNI
ncbi:MAG TPA: carboxypeptidase-like regulatory domain-containing protein, partial [Saprospiraceae bacterium]|nr:carboxypeptidase-like regulatory domain-containing protein [Saprospiraceae bacterium]